MTLMPSVATISVFPITFNVSMALACVFPVAAVMNVSSTAPNPIVANPNTIGIWWSTIIINNISRLFGYIIFTRAR